MVERKHISLFYQYNDNWIGGTYYILNILRALNTLPDDKKPTLNIYCSKNSSLVELENIEYPYINYIKFNAELSFFKRAINVLFLKAFKKEFFLITLPSKRVSNFYYKTFIINGSNIDKYYFWIPDFQDLYLPQFFTPKELKQRSAHYERLVLECDPVVFSSQSALNDFNKFYPQNKNIKKVLPFVSINNSNYKSLSITDLKDKFKITQPYFIVSNQFWKHKNHKVVLKAFKILCSNTNNVQLLFTGKEYDYRDIAYTDEIKQYVTDNNLNNVKFLGFINRNEQLKLMSESIAIIQPSLFEGWSTVVEDAKFMNKTIICSDISVHREQLPLSDLFFDPYNEHELVEKMKIVLSPRNNENKPETNYLVDVSKYAYSFIDLF